MILDLDVTPCNIGFQMPNGEIEVLIPRNTPIPVVKRWTFTATDDNMSTVCLEVLQGFSKLAVRNKLLAKVWITGIKPAPKGTPVIDVTFDVDSNGILSISAEEIGSGEKKSVAIEQLEGFSRNDIDKMIKEEEQRRTEEARAGFERESRVWETHYDILGVSRNATQDEIKKAYGEAIKKCHPGTFFNQPEWLEKEAEEMSKKLNEAYEVLSDVNKRKEYDKKIGRES
jgi:molecular chaperone DnaK